MGFIEDYLEYTKYQESPEIFHKWVAIGLISSCLERNVWIDMGYWKVYPNLYVFLIAGTAICRKSTAIDVGVDLLHELQHPPNIIESKITPAALVKRIAIHTVGDENEADRACAATIVASELANFLSMDKVYEGLVPLLTQLYDNRKFFESSTISRGTDRLKEPSVTLLIATTLSWLRQSMSTYGLEGGFTNRCNIIYRETSERCISRPVLSEESYAAKKRLIDRMNDIRLKADGVMRETDEAKIWWDNWYRQFHASMQNTSTDNDIYHARKDSTMMKLAIIMSMAESDSMVIDVKHYELAEKCIGDVDINIIGKVGLLNKPTEFYNTTQKIIEFLRGTKRCMRSRSYIEKGLRHHIRNIKQFNEIMNHLIDTGDIIIVKAPRMKMINDRRVLETRYHLKEEGEPINIHYFPEYM